jgi:hypothetical protein
VRIARSKLTPLGGDGFGVTTTGSVLPALPGSMVPSTGGRVDVVGGEVGVATVEPSSEQAMARTGRRASKGRAASLGMT